MLALLGERDVTHVAVAFDHVIESFRNELYPATRPATASTRRCSPSSAWPRTRAARSASSTWPMIEFECDDALATAAARFAADRARRAGRRSARRTRISHSACGATRVVCLDRIRRKRLDERGVREKFGVTPEVDSRLARARRRSGRRLSGRCRAGARSRRPPCSAPTKSSRQFRTDANAWEVAVRGAPALAASLAEQPRRCVPVPSARDAAHGRPARGVARRACVGAVRTCPRSRRSRSTGATTRSWSVRLGSRAANDWARPRHAISP